MSAPEVSNRHYIDAWSLWAEQAENGELRQTDGLQMAWAGISWPICNAFFLRGPVHGEEELRQRLEQACTYARGKDRLWLFYACLELLPPPARERLIDLAAECGLAPLFVATGMEAPTILPPTKDLPSLEIRRVADAATRRAVGELNAQAYGVPLEWGQEALGPAAMWSDKAFGYVGYVDGRPVTTATAILLEEVVYIVLVATPEESQRRGYGETILRHALDSAWQAAGPRPTHLHSTEAGRVLYENLGYRPVAEFQVFIPAPAGS